MRSKGFGCYFSYWTTISSPNFASSKSLYKKGLGLGIPQGNGDIVASCGGIELQGITDCNHWIIIILDLLLVDVAQGLGEPC